MLLLAFSCRPSRSATAACIQASTAFQSSRLTSARFEKRLAPSCSRRASSILPHAQKWAYDLQHALITIHDEPCSSQYTHCQACVGAGYWG